MSNIVTIQTDFDPHELSELVYNTIVCVHTCFNYVSLWSFKIRPY